MLHFDDKKCNALHCVNFSYAFFSEVNTVRMYDKKALDTLHICTQLDVRSWH